jgi:hypothetical protein
MMMMYSQLIKVLILAAIAFQCTAACVQRDAHKKNSSSEKQEAMADQREDLQQASKTLVVQGILDSAGNELIKINKPALYNRPLSLPMPNLRTGRYMVLINYNEADSMKTYFDALVGGDREGKMQHGFFEVQIPVKDLQIQSVKMIEVPTRKVLSTFRREDIILK